MREALKGLEADDLLARTARGNADTSDDQIGERREIAIVPTITIAPPQCRRTSWK